MSTTTTVTKTSLTPSELKALMSETKVSTYKPDLIKMVQGNLKNADGEIVTTYVDVMTIFPYKGKVPNSVYNSFNNNLKTLRSENPQWPDLVLVKSEDSVFLINNTLLEGATDEDSE